jgi:hypothetical protein
MRAHVLINPAVRKNIYILLQRRKSFGILLYSVKLPLIAPITNFRSRRSTNVLMYIIYDLAYKMYRIQAMYYRIRIFLTIQYMRGISNGVKETGKETKVILKQNKYKSCVLLLTEAPSFNKHTRIVASALLGNQMGQITHVRMHLYKRFITFHHNNVLC